MLVVAPAGSFHHHQRAAAAADDPVLPLITAAAQRTLVGADAATAAAGNGNGKPPVSSSAGAIQFWHQELAAAADGSSSPGKKALALTDHGRGGSGPGSGAATCLDCGNQAKKGCAHTRCRTCCNSRGFECDTHVRSTWVPAARRRERVQVLLAGSGAGASPPPPTPTATKKPRLACPTPTTTTTTNSRASTSNATTPRSFDTSSRDASFKESLPRQVRGPAVFRCVRVTSVDDGGGGGEMAYQAAVTINGHLFTGLLYDHGAEAAGRAASAAVTMPTASDLNLSSAAAAAAAASPDLFSGVSAPLILGGLGYGNAS